MNRLSGPKRWRPACGRLALFLVAAAGAAAAAPAAAARGDNIDERLAKDAPKIVGYLRDHKLTTVGVLRFRVKKGAAPRTLAAGPMNTNMVSRLENVLAVAGDDSGRLRLVADPGGTIAAQRARLSYLDSKGRAALFGLRYKPVGGDAPASVDAFLFGDVVLSDDYTKTTVTAYAFTPERLRPEVVTTFTVPTDRSILADIGENFIIAQRGRTGSVGLNGGRPPDRDHMAVRSVTPNQGLTPEDGPVDPPNTKPPADVKELVDLKLLYKGKEQTIALNKEKNEWQVDPPDSGQSVEMLLRNLSGKRLGVVLTVNGVNTVMKQEGSINDLPKFILDPKEEYRIRGFITMDGRLAPFTVLDSNETSDEILGSENVGMIQLAVFDQEPEKELKVSTRRVNSPEMRTRPRSIRDVRARSNLTRGPNGVIQPDLNSPHDIRIKEVEFPHASNVGVWSIRYLAIRAADPVDKEGSKASKPVDPGKTASDATTTDAKEGRIKDGDKPKPNDKGGDPAP